MELEIKVEAKSFFIGDMTYDEASILRGALKEILAHDFEWFSTEERDAKLCELDSIFE